MYALCGSNSTSHNNVIYYLIHSYRFAIYLYHVHNLNGIVSIILSHELHEPIVLVKLSDPVSWHVYIHCIVKYYKSLCILTVGPTTRHVCSYQWVQLAERAPTVKPLSPSHQALQRTLSHLRKQKIIGEQITHRFIYF